MAELYAKRICKKIFTGLESVDTYINACKWVANNFVSNKKISDKVSYNIKKEYKSGLHLYTVEVYLIIDMKNVNKHHCEICKETHGLFYMNTECNCNSCKLNSFKRRLGNQFDQEKLYVKENL